REDREVPAAAISSGAAPASASASASAAARNSGGGSEGSGLGDESPDAVVWLCELVLEEVVRLGSPGRGSLDTSEGRVRAYAAELCKTPMRLLPGLPVVNSATCPAVLSTIRRLAYLGRRAVLTAGESLVKTVVPDTAYKKLQEFVRMLEGLQQVKTAPLSEKDATAVLQALREQLKDRLEELPSLEDVTADLAPDDEWDVLAVDTSQGGAAGRARGEKVDQARAKKRGPGTKGAKSGATKSRSGTTTTTTTTRTRQTGKAAASRGTTNSRRTNACNAADTDDDSEFDQGCGGAGAHTDTDMVSEDDDGYGRESAAAAASAATKGAGNRVRSAVATAAARPAASQDTTAASDVGTQPGRRSTRAAAAKASEKLEALRSN
ncbi:hypothetical protein Vretimale_12888, partial [Volvox reticuliferus]